MEHRLVVSTVEFFSNHKVECSGGAVIVDDVRREHPLQLQDGDHLDVS
jgi:hypothetical protein